MTREVTVLTVAFGQEGQVAEWYRAWSKTGARCLVCDNGGGLSEPLPAGLEAIPFEGNDGFGQGINRGVLASRTNLVLVTNPDTLPVDDSSLSTLLGSHSRGMISGGFTMDRGGRQVHSTGVWPDIPWVRRQLFRPAETLWRADRLDWIQGSLMLFNRDEFLDMGGFGGAFPLYFEDTDICARAAGAGLRMNYNEKAVFYHCSGTGSSGSTALRLACFHWGMAEFFRFHRSEEYRCAKGLIMLKCLLRAGALLGVKPRNGAGYLAALSALVRNTPPALPERANG